ncbi:MAG: hypothetical protein ACFFBD_25205 [Candidatus Hodarchaeota archaeon]
MIRGYKIAPLSPLEHHSDYLPVELDQKIQCAVVKAKEWAINGHSGTLFPRKVLFHILRYAAQETKEIIHIPLCRITELLPELAIPKSTWLQFPGYLDGLILHTPELEDLISYNRRCSDPNCGTKKDCIGEIIVTGRHKIRSSLVLLDMVLFESFTNEDAIEAARFILNQFLSLSPDFSSTGIRAPLLKKETPLATYFHFALSVGTVVYNFIIPSAIANDKWQLRSVVDGFSFQPPIKEAINYFLRANFRDQLFSSHVIFILGKKFDSELLTLIKKEIAQLVKSDRQKDSPLSLHPQELPCFCLITFSALHNILAELTNIPRDKRIELFYFMHQELLKLRDEKPPTHVLIIGQQLDALHSQEQSFIEVLRKW